MAPPTCTAVKNVSHVEPYTFIELIVARVQCVREPKFFTITDFGSRQLSGMECEVVVNFSNEWHPQRFPRAGDVVVLKRFKKLKGTSKNNSMLYFNRAQSEVLFYDHQKRVYGKHSMRRYSTAVEEFSPYSDNYRYASSLIDDWKTDPRATVRATTTEMTIQEAHDRFDTTRLVTLKGKLTIKRGRYYLTDAPDWSVRLEGHEVEDALEYQLDKEERSYVQLLYAKCQQVLINEPDKARMRVKITDLTIMTTLPAQDRMKLQQKLNPAPMFTPDQSREEIRPSNMTTQSSQDRRRRTQERNPPPMSTPDQSREDIRSSNNPVNKPMNKPLDNLDVWEPDEDELDDLFDAVAPAQKEVPTSTTKEKRGSEFSYSATQNYMTPNVTLSDSPNPVEEDSSKDDTPKFVIGRDEPRSETGGCSPLASDDSLNDFVAYLCNERVPVDPPSTPVKKSATDDLPSTPVKRSESQDHLRTPKFKTESSYRAKHTMVTSTPKSRGIRSPTRDLTEQLLKTVKKKKVD